MTTSGAYFSRYWINTYEEDRSFLRLLITIYFGLYDNIRRIISPSKVDVKD